MALRLLEELCSEQVNMFFFLSTWRTFLEELATKKGLNLLDVIHKLEMCGKPAYTKAAR